MCCLHRLPWWGQRVEGRCIFLFNIGLTDTLLHAYNCACQLRGMQLSIKIQLKTTFYVSLVLPDVVGCFITWSLVRVSLFHSLTHRYSSSFHLPLVLLLKELQLQARFLHTIDILSWTHSFLGGWLGCCHVHCRMCSSVPGYYPLAVSSTSPSTVTSENMSLEVTCPLRGQNRPWVSTAGLTGLGSSLQTLKVHICLPSPLFSEHKTLPLSSSLCSSHFRYD